MGDRTVEFGESVARAIDMIRANPDHLAYIVEQCPDCDADGRSIHLRGAACTHRAIIEAAVIMREGWPGRPSNAIDEQTASEIIASARSLKAQGRFSVYG